MMLALLAAALGVSAAQASCPTGPVPYSKLGFEMLFHYRQTARLDVDPLGDYALAVIARETPKKIYWSLRRKEGQLDSWDTKVAAAQDCALSFFGLAKADESVPEREKLDDEKQAALFESPAHLAQLERLPVPASTRERMVAAYHSGQLELEGRQTAIHRAQAVRAFMQVIAEERRAGGFEPIEGKPHGWSREFLKHYRLKFAPFVIFPKILVALSRGETGKYMVTGAEQALTEWILEQPYRSISLAEMFRASYRLNRGDVYLALMTVENLLARNWRVGQRELLPITLRLKPLINHLGRHGDLYGAWYHLFGAMVFGYAHGTVRAWLVTATESLGSHVLGRGEAEDQEDFVNSDGARIGGALRKAMKKKQYATQPYSVDATRDESYLFLGEDYTKRLQIVARQYEN